MERIAVQPACDLEHEDVVPPRTADTASFDRVYRDNFRFVWRVLRSMQVSEAQIEDAVQEVFIIVHRKLESFDGSSSVKSWLFTIAMNVARNSRRSERRKGGTTSLEEGLPDEAADPSRTLENNEALALVLAAASTLSEDLRIVFVLTELEQMTAPEIAEILCANLNTISSRVRRAREAFRVALERRMRGER